MEKIAGAAHWKQKELVVCSTLASCSKAGFCLGFFPMIEVSNMNINGIVPSCFCGRQNNGPSEDVHVLNPVIFIPESCDIYILS